MNNHLVLKIFSIFTIVFVLNTFSLAQESQSHSFKFPDFGFSFGDNSITSSKHWNNGKALRILSQVAISPSFVIEYTIFEYHFGNRYTMEKK